MVHGVLPPPTSLRSDRKEILIPILYIWNALITSFRNPVHVYTGCRKGIMKRPVPVRLSMTDRPRISPGAGAWLGRRGWWGRSAHTGISGSQSKQRTWDTKQLRFVYQTAEIFALSRSLDSAEIFNSYNTYLANFIFLAPPTPPPFLISI